MGLVKHFGRGHRVVARARPGRTWATAPGAGASPEGSPPLTHRDTPATPVATRTPPLQSCVKRVSGPSSKPPQAPDTFLRGAGELRTPNHQEGEQQMTIAIQIIAALIAIGAAAYTWHLNRRN